MADSLKKNPFEDKNDDEIRNAIINGNNEALIYLLVEQCGKYFKKLCDAYPYTEMTCDDLVAEVYLCLCGKEKNFKALADFKGVNVETGKSCKLTTYVNTIATRLIRKKNIECMKEVERSESLTNEEGLERDIKDENSIWGKLDAFEISRTFNTLTPRERLVLIEYEINGRRPEVVAEMLNITVSNLYTLSSRVRDSVEKILELNRRKRS
jgi:DNA-directed RNA polymerase specialized sigma24 family protein